MSRAIIWHCPLPLVCRAAGARVRRSSAARGVGAGRPGGIHAHICTPVCDGAVVEGAEQVDATACTYCMAWRDGLPIMVSRGVRVPIREKWAELKHYE